MGWNKKIPPAVCLKQNLRRLRRRQSTLFRATILGSVEPPPRWQRKPTGGRALKGVTTAVSPSVLALRSEQGRDSFPRVATQPEKGRTTSSSARTKPGEGGQQGALRTATQHGTTPSTQQQLAPMWRWSGESRNEVGGQRRPVAHPTSPATSYSPVHPRIPHNPRPRSKGMKERVGGLCCARQRMD